MKTVAKIQARIRSSRLRGKVLFDLGGKTALERIVIQAGKAKGIDEVRIATTTNSRDEVIVSEAERIGVKVYRGSEDDVLDRYTNAARESEADIVLRLTADCPLLDHRMIDFMIDKFNSGPYDYASNRINRTYPRGQDTEVMTMETLEKAWSESTKPHERVHVTPYIYQNPSMFEIYSVFGPVDWSHQRWTIDTEDDFEFLKAVCNTFDTDMGWEKLAKEIEKHPEILKLNAHIKQRSMYDVPAIIR